MSVHFESCGEEAEAFAARNRLMNLAGTIVVLITDAS